jgi:hypothetical protein
MAGLADKALAPYPSPQAADDEVQDLAREFPERCVFHVIGRSTQGRPLGALRIHGGQTPPSPRPRLLVTAHIHAVEYIGAYVARAVARRLVHGYGQDEEVTSVLNRADVWCVPLLNPDGAWRVWEARGWTGLGSSRVTANGVDPNRNFPFVPLPGRGSWNSASDRPGSAYYRGPQPLSEPECLALARLCKQQRFCAAINFHSFGGVVFLPETRGPDAVKAQQALDVFRGEFQSRQPYRRYRPIPERSAKILGQLDPFLLDAFGTASVTVEVSRPGRHLLNPRKTPKVFWWANPGRPDRWAENDTAATVHALSRLLDCTGGSPCRPAHPELAERVPDGEA